MQYEEYQHSQILGNSKETIIFFQASSFDMGYSILAPLICSKLDKREEKMACIIATTIVARGIGYLAAKQQIDRLSPVCLKNDQMEALYNAARNYNNKVASYHTGLKKDIQQLKLARVNQEYTESKLNAAKNNQNKVKETFQVRRRILAKLSDNNQRRRYAKTLRRLKSEKERLDASIRKLARRQ